MKTPPPPSEEPRTITDGYSLPNRGGEAIMRRERILSDASLDGDEYDNLIARLELLFESEKLYLEPEVRITSVAEQLRTSKTNLSKAIKMKTGKNFCQLVHYYRVREAMRLYAANQKLSITQLYKAVGFNSKTTFNTAFGRNTGSSPAEWCKNFRKTSEITGKGNGKNKRSKG
ncbi:MAG: AraC family transcriptional regulator [Bacteroidales bacterium]|nr:AraC family transcriptional regulator [Bacteroidales bacterium]